MSKSDRRMNLISLIATLFCSGVAIMRFSQGDFLWGLFQLLLAIGNGYLYLKARNRQPLYL